MNDKIDPHFFTGNFVFELTDFIKTPRSPHSVPCKNLAADFIMQNLNHYKIDEALITKEVF